MALLVQPNYVQTSWSAMRLIKLPSTGIVRKKGPFYADLAAVGDVEYSSAEHIYDPSVLKCWLFVPAADNSLWLILCTNTFNDLLNLYILKCLCVSISAFFSPARHFPEDLEGSTHSARCVAAIPLTTLSRWHNKSQLRKLRRDPELRLFTEN